VKKKKMGKFSFRSISQSTAASHNGIVQLLGGESLLSCPLPRPSLFSFLLIRFYFRLRRAAILLTFITNDFAHFIIFLSDSIFRLRRAATSLVFCCSNRILL